MTGYRTKRLSDPDLQPYKVRLLGFRSNKAGCLFRHTDAEGGFTSIGVVIALSLVVTLVFTSSQIYWLNSRAGDIQFAADAGALAAENTVAEFYIIARVTDAVLLSLTLFGVTVMGVSIIVSLIPGCQSIAIDLMEFALKVFDARDRIAEAAIPALTQLQKILPFVAIANAASTVQANAPSGSNYVGVALLVPFIADDAEENDNGTPEFQADAIDSSNQQAGEAVNDAEQAEVLKQLAFEAGWLADCGNSALGGRCMYERARRLAALSDNQYFTLDEWGFDKALIRAQNYYQARLANERPENTSADEITRSMMRGLYYQYAIDTLDGGYVRDDGSSHVQIYLPELPQTPSDFRSTSVYHTASFPLDAAGFLHGHTGCPDYLANGALGQGTIAELDSGVHAGCPTCNMTWTSVSRVFGVSSQTDSGFEFWYDKVVKASIGYQVAANEYLSALDRAQNHAEDALDQYEQAVQMVKAKRVDLHPPGRKGCVIFVFAPPEHTMPPGLISALIPASSQTVLPTRIAVSAAALAKDCNTEAHILACILDRLKASGASETGQTVLGGFDFVLEVWGYALLFYESGVEGLTGALRAAATISSGGLLGWLANWAADAVETTLKNLGMQPVDLRAPKPLLVNSYHVANAAGDSALGQTLIYAKNSYALLPGNGSGTLLDMVFDGIMIEVETFAHALVEDGWIIAVISFGQPLIPVEIDLTVRLPESAVENGVEIILEKLRELKDLFGGENHDSTWE
ncbi:MAG: hypothetical protein FWD45_06500 [Coriobacteriia bacterium]|nr:hypothetical protein [Coriobacteriia bacterium]